MIPAAKKKMAAKSRPKSNTGADAPIALETRAASVPNVATGSAPSKNAVGAAPTILSRVTKPDQSAKTMKAPEPAQAAKPAKAKKSKLVRDSFTFPSEELAALTDMKVRAAKLATPVKKSTLVRAGLKALASMADALFMASLKAIAVRKSEPGKKGRKN